MPSKQQQQILQILFRSTFWLAGIFVFIFYAVGMLSCYKPVCCFNGNIILQRLPSFVGEIVKWMIANQPIDMEILMIGAQFITFILIIRLIINLIRDLTNVFLWLTFAVVFIGIVALFNNTYSQGALNEKIQVSKSSIVQINEKFMAGIDQILSFVGKSIKNIINSTDEQ